MPLTKGFRQSIRTDTRYEAGERPANDDAFYMNRAASHGGECHHVYEHDHVRVDTSF